MKKKNNLKYAALSSLLGLAVAGAGVFTPLSFTYAADNTDDISSNNTVSDSNVRAADDASGQTSKFTVSDIVFTPDTAAPGDTVTVRALTNLSKSHISSLTMEIPVNNEKTESVHLVHGDNDILEGSFTIGDNWANGNHSVSSLKVTASDNSVSDYDLSDTSVGAFNVIDSKEDFDPPIVHSVTLDRSEARVGEAVTISVDATHSSDIEELIITFADEGNVTHSVSFENGAKVHTKDLSGWDEGTYRITGIFIRDKSGNREYYEEYDNLDEVETPTLFISNNYTDTQGPLVTSATFDKQVVKPGDYLTLSVSAHDSTGISYISAEVANSKDETKTYYLFDDGEGNYNTEFSITESFLNGEYRILRIQGEDTLGNKSSFEPGDDTKELEVNTFTVRDSSQDREAPQIRSIELRGSRLRPGQKGAISFRLSDANDVTEASIGLYHENTNEALDIFDAVLQDDGSYLCEFTVDNQWYNGSYDIRVSTADNLANAGNYETGLKITVYDSAEDYEAPEVVSIVADKTDVKPGDVVTFTSEIFDASLIDYIYGSFIHDGEFDTDPQGEEQIFTFTRDSDGLYKMHVAISNRWQNGEHELLMHTMDQWSNYADDIETGVVINVSDSIEDREGPEVTSILFDKTDAVPGDEFHITAQASDPSGISFVRIYLEPNYADMDGSFNPHLIVTLHPDEEGNLRATDLVDNAWINSTYEVDYIEAVDRLGNIRIYDEEEIFDLYENDEMELNFLNIHDSTHTNTDIHVSEVTFDKEKVNIGDTVNVTAKVEGTATVKSIEIEIADDHYDQQVWDGHIALEPDDEGNITGSFRVSPNDVYWQKDVTYGIISVHVLDTNNSSRYYADNTGNEDIEDLRNIVKNRFTVDTYAEPVINPADYTRVERAKERIPKDLSIYTDESVAALNEALEAVDYDKIETEQVIVDNYATAIFQAVNGLELKRADYSEVDKALANVPKDTSIYTADSVKALNETVNVVVRDKLMDEQADVDGYAAAINKALDGLVILGADYSKVEKALEAVPDGLDVYTDDSLAALSDALGAVEKDKNITQQSEVDGYAERILAAIEELKIKPADYSGVDKALEDVPEELSKYTDESVAALKKAIEAVIRDKDITEQEAVDKYAADILAAVKGLKEKPAAATAPVTKPAATAATTSAAPTAPVASPAKAPAPVIESKVVEAVSAPSSPETGDKSTTPLWVGAIAAVTGIGAAIAALRRRKE